jgi:tRNA pseudouridine38-40 synthase
MTVAYDGTAYAGWQVQPDKSTVQGTIEAAIFAASGERLRLTAAGRTDSGVHALGQEVCFTTAATIPPHKWAAALRVHLPDDIVVRSSREVAADFHATYSAKSKRYRYVLRFAADEDPFLRRYAWRLDPPPDLNLMRQALPSLLGTQDFRCFESKWPNKATSVRTMLDVRLLTLDRWPGWCPTAIPRPDRGQAARSSHTEFVALEFEADGFLYNMVRAIVGTLVRIGRGDWPPQRLAEIIAGQDRAAAGETAPPQGLYLVSVTY